MIIVLHLFVLSIILNESWKDGGVFFDGLTLLLIWSLGRTTHGRRPIHHFICKRWLKRCRHELLHSREEWRLAQIRVLKSCKLKRISNLWDHKSKNFIIEQTKLANWWKWLYMLLLWFCSCAAPRPIVQEPELQKRTHWEAAEVLRYSCLLTM